MNIRSILGLSHGLISQNLLIKGTNRKVLLPFYHTVSNEKLPHISHLYPLRNTELFIKDLEFFCKYYQPISIETLNEVVTGQKVITKPVFHLTFDDGLREVYTVIAPILERKGIPATVFLNSGFIDNKALFYRYKISLLIDAIENNNEQDLSAISQVLQCPLKNKKVLLSELLSLTYADNQKIEDIALILGMDFNDFLKNKQPYMNSIEIKNWIDRGFSIGSHSMDHPLFKHLSIEEQKLQVSNCFNQLEKQFGIKSKYFSFPFTDEGVSAGFFNWLYNHEGCKLTFGISGLKDDFTKFHLHRIPIEGTLKSSNEIIKTEYFYYLFKAIINKNKIERI